MDFNSMFEENALELFGFVPNGLVYKCGHPLDEAWENVALGIFNSECYTENGRYEMIVDRARGYVVLNTLCLDCLTELKARKYCPVQLSQRVWHHSLNAFDLDNGRPIEAIARLERAFVENEKTEICVTQDADDKGLGIYAGSWGVGLAGQITAVFSGDVHSVTRKDGTRHVTTGDAAEAIVSMEDFHSAIKQSIYCEAFMRKGTIKYLWYLDRADLFAVAELKKIAQDKNIPCVNLSEADWINNR